MKEMQEPLTEVVLDTAVGLVKAEAQCQDGKVTKVTLDMPPAFVAKKDATTDTDAWGSVTYDLCFGGVFYALVDADQIELDIKPENARALAGAGVSLWQTISAQTTIQHPEIPEVSGLAYVMFRAQEPDGAVRTCTTLRPGRVDRSPCGTGSNANMAVQLHSGQAEPGSTVVSRSIIGGEFTTQLIETGHVGPYTAAQNRVSGQCWIYGISQIGLDPTDPFPEGFTLSDTWGG